MRKNEPLQKLSKIILVDDHPLFREGIKLLIEMEQLGEVVAEASNGVEFIALLKIQTPDVAIIDIDMPVMNGLQATELALKIQPDIKILVLSMHGNPNYYSSSIEAGAKGFILKTAGKTELENAICKIINGESFFSQELLLTIINDLINPKTSDKKEMKLALTERENETLTYFCQGLSACEIAEKMFLSPKTIEVYRSKLLQKTETKNTLSLVLYAIKTKLVTNF